MDFDVTFDSDISDTWEESRENHEIVEHRIDDELEEQGPVKWTHEYAPFSHVFIKVASLTGLVGCDSQSVFMVIRVKKEVPVIKTTNFWCAGEVIDVDCGYSLDFTQVPEFELSEFTPVIEVHRRDSKRAEFVGLCLLPLRVMSIELYKGKDMTFFYKNSVIPLRSLENGGTVGFVTVTVAFGFPEQAKMFESAYEIQKERDENNSAMIQQQQTIEEEKRRIRRERRRLKKRKQRESRWQKIAIAMGWKPPEYVGDGWKKKAKKQGWNPPRNVVYSSIQIGCDWFDVAPRTEASVQTQFVRTQHHQEIEDVLDPEPSSGSIPEDEDEDLMNLIGLLNKNNKKKKNQKEYVLVSPSCLIDFGAIEKPACRLVSHGVLFEYAQEPCPEDDSSMLSEIEQSIQELVHVSGHDPISKVMLSESDSDEVPETPSVIKPLLDVPVDCPSLFQSSDNEEEDESEHMASSESSDMWAHMKNIDPEIQNYLQILNGS